MLHIYGQDSHSDGLHALCERISLPALASRDETDDNRDDKVNRDYEDNRDDKNDGRDEERQKRQKGQWQGTQDKWDIRTDGSPLRKKHPSRYQSSGMLTSYVGVGTSKCSAKSASRPRRSPALDPSAARNTQVVG